ncbi:MAG: hypothetical protein WC728_01925 [Elusimicrobiota bacterium]
MLKEYLTSRRFPTDILLVVLGLALWLILLFFGLTLIMIFPQAASNPATYTALLGSLALAVGAVFAMGLRPRLRAAFGIQSQPTGLKLPVLCFGAALLAFAASVALSNALWNRRFAALKEEFEAKGLPVSLAEFQRDLPEGDYGQPVLEPLLADFDKENFYGGKLHPGEKLQPWTKKILEEELPFVKRFEPVLAKHILPKLRRFPAYAKVDWVAASKNPWGSPVPKYADLIKLGSVLRLCAVSSAFTGAPAKAWNYVRSHLDFADTMAPDNWLISKMISLGLRNQAVRAALTIMLNDPKQTLPADLAGRLEAALGTNLAADGLRAELAAHWDSTRFFKDVTFSKYQETGGLSFDSNARRPGWVEYVFYRLLISMGFFEANASVVLKSLGGFAAATTWPQAKEAISSDRESDIYAAIPAWPYLLAAVAMPRFGDMLRKDWESKTWIQLALACSALARHRAAAGRYPRGLADLPLKLISKDLLIDVFSGQPFAYAQTGGGLGFELCSAGADGDKKDSRGDILCVRQGG